MGNVSLLGMLNIVDSILNLMSILYGLGLLGMLNIVDSILHLAICRDNACLLGMLNIVDSILTINNGNVPSEFARYVKYSG